MAVVTSMNCAEKKALEEFQMRMKGALTPYMLEDPTIFYRFLKARDIDVDKAEKMMRKSIIWRKVNRADTILRDFKPREVYTKYLEPSFVGHDNYGDMVSYIPPGRINVCEGSNCFKMNDMMKHFIWRSEKEAQMLKENNAKTGNTNCQLTQICDLEDLTLGNAMSKLIPPLLLNILQLYQDNYPESLKYFYVINAPSIFVYVFAILKPMMSAAMVEKFHIHGRNGWKEKLVKFVDADVLPVFLGGNRTDPDGNPLCKSFITFGGKIPEKYFLSNEERYFQDSTRVEKITIPSSEKKEIYVAIKEEGSVLQWEFLVKSKDIGFGLLFETPELEVLEILPLHKRETSDGTERDSYKCNSTGRCIIIFDNTHSWMRSKEVEYCTTILVPNA